jgi:hypothetical protein
LRTSPVNQKLVSPIAILDPDQRVIDSATANYNRHFGILISV